MTFQRGSGEKSLCSSVPNGAGKSTTMKVLAGLIRPE